MKIEAVKIVSAPIRGNWSQVHVFIPEDEEKLQKRGQIFAVFSLKNLVLGTEEEIVSAGKELIARFHEEYYGFLENSPFNQLRKTHEEILKEVLPEGETEIVSGALLGNIFYLGITGLGKIILKRGEKISFILQGEKENSLKIASGPILSGDVFILGTQNFFEIIPPSVMGTALKSGSAQRAGEILTPLVLGKEEGLASALILEAKEEEEEKGESQVLIEEQKRKLEIKKAIINFLLKVKNAITQPPPEKPKKSYFTLALILLLILGVSMVFGTKERRKQEKEKKIEAILEQVKTKKEESEALLNLNPVKAREILKESAGLLNQIEEEEILSSQLKTIKQELENSLKSILREYNVEEKLFFDLELIKKGAVGSSFCFSGEQIIILDKENLSIYSLLLKDKKSAILAGGEKVKELTKIVSFGGKIFALGEGGIYQIKNGEISLIIRKDNQWEEVKDLATFGGNLYLLDRRNIWLYPALDSGFGSKRAWLKSEKELSGAIKMAIDGFIWVLNSSGEINKYLRGGEEEFRIVGLDKEFSEPATFFTSSEDNYLYILDKGNSRVVVLSKKGEYYSQYQNSQIKNALDLVVSEKEGKIFLLEGSRIYQIEMEPLGVKKE